MQQRGVLYKNLCATIEPRKSFWEEFFWSSATEVVGKQFLFEASQRNTFKCGRPEVRRTHMILVSLVLDIAHHGNHGWRAIDILGGSESWGPKKKPTKVEIYIIFEVFTFYSWRTKTDFNDKVGPFRHFLDSCFARLWFPEEWSYKMDE